MSTTIEIEISDALQKLDKYEKFTPIGADNNKHYIKMISQKIMYTPKR